jgi:hypothetical protein
MEFFPGVVVVVETAASCPPVFLVNVDDDDDVQEHSPGVVGVGCGQK